MPNTALAKIRTRAKAILKKHPGKKYQTALKEAGRDYKAGRISGTKKRKPKSMGAKKRISGTKRKVSGKGRVGGLMQSKNVLGSVAQQTSMLKHSLKEQLGWLLVSIKQEKTKTGKKKLRAKAVILEKKLKALG